jgi:hypothetical protein
MSTLLDLLHITNSSLDDHQRLSSSAAMTADAIVIFMLAHLHTPRPLCLNVIG